MYNANYYEQNFGYYGPSLYDNTHARALYVYDKDAEISFKKKEFSHYRKTNHLGLCDRDYAQHKSDTVFRIIVFGDSFTEGVGVTADKTWVKLLEGKLNAEGLKYEVFNAGISGSDPFFGFYLLKNELISYKPDMVLLAVNPSDINDIIVRGGFERFGTNNSVVYNKPPWWEILYAHSYVLRTVLHQGLGYDNNLMSKNDHDINQKKALKDLLKVSVWYKKLAEHKNFKFYTVIHPDFTSVFKGMYNGLGDYGNELKKLQINYIDILPVFLKDLQKKETMNSLFWPVDKHYTEKGQELMADEVFNAIKKELNK